LLKKKSKFLAHSSKTKQFGEKGKKPILDNFYSIMT